MANDIDELRARLGASAALWAGPAGVRMTAHGWTAFSGAQSVDYNVALCVGDGDELEACVEGVLARRTPAVVMLAGEALGEAQRLVARDWVCVGATPLMVRALGDERAPARRRTPPDPAGAVRPLDTAADLDAARELVARVFDIEPELAAVAVPAFGADHRLWGAFEAGALRSCLALAAVQETVVVWSMATDAPCQGRGYGRAALQAALAAAAAAGAQRALLYASPAGEPFYRRLGFAELERWQMWSRPRWVLGRA